MSNRGTFDNEYKKTLNKKEIDEVYEEIGYGKYQIKVLLLFSMHFMFGSLFLLTPSFFFQLPIFMCNGEQCNEEQYCSGKYEDTSIDDKNSVDSISYQYKLYCKDSYLNTIGQALPFGGAMLGLFFFMWVGDNFGRKICIGTSWLTGSLGGLLMVAFNSQLYTIFIGIFITGFGLVPANFVELVMLNEISTGHKRSMSICFMYVAFGIAELFIWPLSLATNNWRQFNFYFLVIPYLVLNIAYLFLYESPKFLQQRDLDVTAETLMKIAKQNGKEDYILTSLDLEKVDKGSQSNYSYIDIFKYKSVRTFSLCMVVLSMGIHILYYGMQTSLDMIGKDFAENSFYVGLADFFGYLISDIVCPKMKRKRNLNITLFIAALFCFSFALDPVTGDCLKQDETCIEKTLQIAQAVAARFIISFSFSFMIIWMQELYPTSVRSIGVGFCSALGIGAAQLGPVLKDFSEKIHVNVIIILGFFGILGCFVSFFLPETFNKPLLEEIPELTRRYSENQGKFRKISDFRDTQTKRGKSEFEARQRLLSKEENN